MGDASLGDRQQALEDRFFSEANRAALERLRTVRQRAEAREQLAEVAGLKDWKSLDRLADLGVRAETWIALTLVPLIEVAWADGRIDPEERAAILAAATRDGIAPGAPAHELLESWLAARPGAELLASWEDLAQALCARFEPPERGALRDAVMGRALRVAEAAGGFLDFGDPVCVEERAVMARLDKAFGG